MQLSKMSTEEILEVVEPIMDNCLAGANENDHAKHVEHFYSAHEGASLRQRS
ncbi:MAG: hypothetical protein CM15mP68_2440 [Pseudomonadota bacterium]|nr:MAG: hypothetical protein CM15mP68_2440 [Pseudomonadota bacterium]